MSDKSSTTFFLSQGGEAVGLRLNEYEVGFLNRAC